MIYKTFAESDLVESRSRRSQAEAAREKVEEETVDATRRFVEGLRSEAKRNYQEAEALRIDAARVVQQAETERARAREASEDASRARDTVVAQAQQKAQEILDQARAAAQREGTELRRQALLDIKEIMTRVEKIRAATDEEFETQRIFSNIAKFKAASAAYIGETSPEQVASGSNSAPSTDNGGGSGLRAIAPKADVVPENQETAAPLVEQGTSAPPASTPAKPKDKKSGKQ